ncbi:uncharacterized protein LOC124536085 [Vanessa cardui]|uniref:uncharacterized protein LOC124536085 n=1 Tax=Vanessa cardui TaxID=171605 RepID=UPI001F12C3AF|nr:uncharacterized protein LOC124536085 [Vanessa cardui]
MFKLVVLSCVLAAASASALFQSYVPPLAPLAYSPFFQPYNYRGPYSLAPGQPANILGSDGRPLDTLDVNLDRSAHYAAKALDNGFHILKKRSAAYIAPYAAPYASPYAVPYAAPYATPYAAAYAAPLAYSAPLLQPYNYRGPLSLAPGQPANILGSDGRPLDTLEVNLDRSAHFNAQFLKNGVHLLKKRSAGLIAPINTVTITRTPLIASSFAYGSPLAHQYLKRISYAASPITHIF